MILVSACLCGVNCKYNGENNISDPILELLRRGVVIPICPEQLGGLNTPREPCEIIGGDGKDVLLGKAKVISINKKDCTCNFIRGAYETLNIAKVSNVRIAILKANSPSCGFGKIYDGTFNGFKKSGNGVTSELLSSKGIKIFNENEWSDNIGL